MIGRANSLKNECPHGFNKCFPEKTTLCTVSNIEEAKFIIEKETEIRDWEQFYNEVVSIIKSWEKIPGPIPHYFYINYYSVNYNDKINRESIILRQRIWDFKNGNKDVASIFAKYVINKLKSVFSENSLKKLTFICIPASTKESNIKRYESFSNEICSGTGMRNGFQLVTIIKEKEPSHYGGRGALSSDYLLSDDLKGSYVVLFDDVVTRGNSMLLFRNLLIEKSAKVICAISLGRTTTPDTPLNPHPILINNN